MWDSVKDKGFKLLADDAISWAAWRSWCLTLSLNFSPSACVCVSESVCAMLSGIQVNVAAVCIGAPIWGHLWIMWHSRNARCDAMRHGKTRHGATNRVKDKWGGASLFIAYLWACQGRRQYLSEQRGATVVARGERSWLGHTMTAVQLSMG